MHFYIHKDEHVNLTNIENYRCKYGYLLIFACFFLYMSSMAAKAIFAAEQKYIADLWLNGQNGLASMANTFYFVPYGLVQIVLFFIMKKINIFKYLLITVPLAAISTMLIGVSSNIYQIWIYFGLCGLFQTGIYCGCNYALTQNLPAKLCTLANRVMNCGYAFGSVLSYCLCAFCIGRDLWRLPYFIVGAISLISIFVFILVLNKAKRFKHINEMMDSKRLLAKKTDANNLDAPLITLDTKKKTVLFYVILLLLTFLITSLYYSVMNYVTTLLVGIHKLPDDISIYVSIIAPVAIVFGPMMTISSCEKDRNFIRQTIIYLLILLPLPVLLYFLYDFNVFVALILVIAFVIISNGIKAIAVSIIAFKMKRELNTASFTAIANAIASIAAGVAPTITGAIIDVAGWQTAYLTIFAVTLLTLIITVVVNIKVTKSNKNIKV